MSKFKTTTVILMTILMFLQAWILGKNDWISLILIAFSTAIMFLAVIKVQTGHKKAFRAATKKNSWLYNFLSEDNTFWLIIISFFLSLFLSILLTVTLKGIILNHGYITLALIIIPSSLILFHLFHPKNSDSFTLDSLQQDVATHAKNLLHFIIISIFLAIILSVFLSYGDTRKILDNNIQVENFVQVAANNQVTKTASNHFTRLLVNLHILVDNFKLAAASLIVQTLFTSPKGNFITLYLIVCLLNFLKLLGFAFAITLMQRGLETIYNKVMKKQETSIVDNQRALQGREKKDTGDITNE